MFTVLYVDDEPALLNLMKIFLEKDGEFRVDTRASAPEALEAITGKSYDAIISDYVMPEMDGIEFLKAVRGSGNSVPFIIFTGRGREEVVIEALNNGADFYLQKGGSPNTLFAELRHVLQRTIQMRQAQMTLAEQEQRYHDLQNANDLIQSVAPDGHFLFVNKKWLDTLGYQEEELPNFTIFDIVHEESLQHCMETFRRVISGENVGIVDAVFKTRKGDKVFVEGMANCKITDGKPQYTRGIFKDVTDRKMAEQELLRKNEELYAAYEEITATDEELRENYDRLRSQEQELRESGDTLRAIVEQSYDGIIIVDFFGMLRFANRKAAEIVDSTEELDTTGRINILEFVAPEMQENAIRDFMQVSAGIDSYPVSYKIVTHAKKEKWLECIGKKISFRGSSAMLLSIRDVTVRRETELALKENEKNFRTIFESSPYPISVNSLPDGRFVAINSAFLQASGYQEAEVLGKSPVEIGLLSLIDFGRLTSRLLLSGKLENVPMALRGKGGIQAHVLFSTIPITINDKPAILTMTVEVTKLKRIEEELLRKNEELQTAYEELTAIEEELRKNNFDLTETDRRYRLILQSANDAILIHEVSKEGPGRFIEVNEQACQMLGYTKDELLDMSIPDIDVPEQKERVPEVLEQLFSTGKVVFQTEFLTKDGLRIPVEDSNRLIDFDGRSAVLCIARDISEQKRSEQVLQAANRKLNLLNSVTRHDIRNKVMLLTGYLSIIKGKTRDKELAGHIKKLESAAEAISQQIEFTKIYQDLGTTAPVWQKLTSSVPTGPGTPGLSLHIVLPDVAVYADPILEKVFSNLLDNTQRHGMHATEIRISAREEPDGLHIVWEDNGVGIPTVEKENIFRKGYGKNTGLGLFLSREILSITGITLVENGVPGEGARFEITVPHGAYRFSEGS